MRHQIRRLIRIGVVALVVLLVPAMGSGTAAVADRGHPVIKKEKTFEGFFYADLEGELIALVGPALAEDNCQGDGFATVTKTYRQRRDGSWTERWRARSTMSIYSSPLDPPAWIAEQCELILSGAAPPEPLATGRGRVRSFISALTSPDGPPVPGARIVNRTKGVVRTNDCQRYRVRARADLVLDDDLNPIGDPADFQSLSVTRIGRHVSGGL